MRLLAAAPVFVMSVGSTLLGQTPAEPLPAFEVASVKPMTEPRSYSFRVEPGPRLSAINVPLSALIYRAYNMATFQVVGMPSWASERFEVLASAPSDRPAPLNQVWPMLRALLEDRFKLRARVETRELPIYLLKLDRPERGLGPGLRPASTDCTTLPNGIIGPGAAGCTITVDAKEVYRLRGRSMARLAVDLQGMAGRVVRDETGVSGLFDAEFAFADPSVPEHTNSAATDSLVTAIREQLGLRLEPARGAVDVLVIESVERPAPN